MTEQEQVGPSMLGKEALRVLHEHLDFIFGIDHMPSKAEQDEAIKKINDLRILFKNESEVLNSTDWCIFGVIPLLARVKPEDLVPLAMGSTLTPFDYGGER